MSLIEKGDKRVVLSAEDNGWYYWQLQHKGHEAGYGTWNTQADRLGKCYKLSKAFDKCVEWMEMPLSLPDETWLVWDIRALEFRANHPLLSGSI